MFHCYRKTEQQLTSSKRASAYKDELDNIIKDLNSLNTLVGVPKKEKKEKKDEKKK